MTHEILEKLEERLTNLGDKCVDGKDHELAPFVYYGKKSDFEDVCNKCGGFKINPKGIYSNTGLLHYIDSDRYETLLKYSNCIKEKNGMDKRKNL